MDVRVTGPAMMTEMNALMLTKDARTGVYLACNHAVTLKAEPLMVKE